MEIFQQLGAKIERIWREKNYDDALFPEICAEALREANLPDKVSVWEITEWALRENYLPVQQDLAGKFGDPPLTLYNSPHFYIDVYFWLEGTTSIHQHSFCGAFQVLLGSSIHSRYNFTTEAQINSHFKIGTTDLREVDLLQIGDVRPIYAGDDFIHALFHLDYPSVTIVVRNHNNPQHLPQFSYHKPAIALNPFFDEPTLQKKQQIISLLLRAKPENADDLIHELLADSDLHASYLLLTNLKNYLGGSVLEEVFEISASKNRFHDFLETVQKKHGSLAAGFRGVFAESERLNYIVSRRHLISDAELRFFLALLLNVNGREPIFALIKSRFPDEEPLEKILDWTETLGRTRTMDLKSANMLGIEDFNDDYVFVLEQMLQGLNLTQISEFVRTTYPPDYAAKIEANLPQMHETLHKSLLFRSLFVA